MTQRARSLLDYRLIVVTGKGGCGKTSVAACLAEAAALAGRRVALAETAATESIAGYFEAHPQPLGYAGRALRPNLHALHIEPYAALAEYLGHQIGSQGLANRMLGGEAIQQLLEIVPGWHELIILGKVWHLEQQTDRTGSPCFDLIVVDAPATGHGATFLDIPRAVQQAVRAGPLSRQARRVERLIHDRDRTLLLPVTLPEELPVLETVELVERARNEIDIAMDRIVVNAMPQPTTPGIADSLEALPESLPLQAMPSAPVLGEIMHVLARRSARAIQERRRVSNRCELPVVDLPYSPTAFQDEGEWATSMDAILHDAVWPEKLAR